ncbi:NTP pyrophosphohydrolase [Rhodococcus sp. HNM0569]|uniref:NTP pyrophosphohydrolase n=1 Tax=Rhodococcus sp. HNM0569 TaxID=2716340 RepID=UPI00146CB303|nr:NTP pyrophosphohydrolase [Rhodococcus sp. HNM0569]NLU81352.1 NTP pyrophosphohydrolase [Rhodococcus sp. HNM0569]
MNPSLDVSSPILVVDAANVVGSRPDGWWRDRRGANKRLRDALADVGSRGVEDAPPPVSVVLVVEGAARGIASSATVDVIDAPASGDDRIVEYVASADRPCIVVTADRELRRRVTALGARVVGPRSVQSPR